MATKLPQMTTGTRATMDKYADWIDSLWCLAFGLTSIGVCCVLDLTFHPGL